MANRLRALTLIVFSFGLVGFEARPKVEKNIAEICSHYSEALVRHPNDHPSAQRYVEAKKRAVLDQDKLELIAHWDADVLKLWAAIPTADPSERYSLFRTFVKRETGKEDWACPAMQTHWQAEVVKPAPEGMPPQPSSSPTGAPVVMGSLDKAVIKQVIHTRLAAFKFCFESRLAKNPNLNGTVKVEFVIASSGAVQSSRALEDTTQDLGLQSCVLEEISKLEFPKPKGGGIVIVKYPFVFKTS